MRAGASYFLESCLADFGFFFLGLAALDVFLDVASLDQVLDLVLQLGALLCDMPNILVIRIVFVLISIRPMSE